MDSGKLTRNKTTPKKKEQSARVSRYGRIITPKKNDSSSSEETNEVIRNIPKKNEQSVRVSRHGRKITPKKNDSSSSEETNELIRNTPKKNEQSVRVSHGPSKITPKKNDFSSPEDSEETNEVTQSKKKTMTHTTEKLASISSKQSIVEVKNNSDMNNTTPRKGKNDAEIEETFSPITPYSFRQRLKNKIECEVEEESPFNFSEESEWDESDSESSESEEEVDMKLSDLPKMIKPDILADRKHHYICSSSDYLDNSSGKSKTSSERLPKLQDAQHISDILSSFIPSHSTHITTLSEKNQSLYYKWMHALNKGFSVLVYGLGSKKKLLDQFRISCLNSCMVLVINGYFPGLTIKEISSNILELLGGKVNESAEMLYSLLDQPNAPHIFFIIHNIDGLVLRRDKTQSFFSQLISREKVHLVASIDHINAPLLWDQKKLSNFNFIWEDCTSYHPYTEEKTFDSSLMVQSSVNQALSSLRNVYRSLNKNSRNIFKLLLDHSLYPNKKNTGMQFSELYRLCRSNFIVSSDLALRTQLTEFIDHQLIKWRKETDMLTISVDSDILTTFKSEIEKD